MVKVFYRLLIVILIILAIMASVVLLFIYIRTGTYAYSDENLAECVAYTPEQAKMRVLQAVLHKENNWIDWPSAQRAANKAGIGFVDWDLRKGVDSWFVPFYDNRYPDKEQFGMLDCGTLIVEFASEK